MEKLTKDMAAHIYVLVINNKFSVSANQKLFLMLGLLFFAQGIIRLFFSDSLPIVIDIILGILLMAGGIGYLIYSYYGFSTQSKYAPRIEVNKDLLLIKSDFFKGANLISWKNIKFLDLGHYSIGIETEVGKHFYNYKTNPENSKNIKSTIREVAEHHQIEVFGS